MRQNARSISFSDEITLAFIHQNFVQYVLGAITLATVSGLIFGIVTFAALKIFKYRQA